MSEPITVAIAYHSAHGHTVRQAHAVASGVESVPGARAELRDVSILDDELWATLAGADAIVFGSPTHFGSQSSVFQAFTEATAQVWLELAWRGKLAAGFTNSAGVNGDKLNTLTSMALFAAQHGMHWVALGLPPGWIYTSSGTPEDLNRLGSFIGAMAQSPLDGGPDVGPSDSDLRTAEHLGARVARTAVELVSGRRVMAEAVAS